jgi:protein-S-isoprenylcysteine O-methyltransferase Ste14
VVSRERPEGKRSLFALITELPYLMGQLIRAELELLRQELIARLKGTGIGLGLLIVALNLVVAFVLLLVLAGVFALALLMPTWAAALTIAGVVLVIALIVGAIGAKLVAGTGSPLPTRTIDNVKEDIATIRGDRVAKKSSSREGA